MAVLALLQLVLAGVLALLQPGVGIEAAAECPRVRPWSGSVQMSLELETKIMRSFAKISNSWRRPLLGPPPA